MTYRNNALISATTRRINQVIGALVPKFEQLHRSYGCLTGTEEFSVQSYLREQFCLGFDQTEFSRQVIKKLLFWKPGRHSYCKDVPMGNSSASVSLVGLAVSK